MSLELQPGQSILNGKYRIERLLGRGGYGQVYLATHTQLRSQRAVKVLHRAAPTLHSSEFDRYQDRFRLEAQLGAQVNDLGLTQVVRVYDVEPFADGLCLVMEYLPGGSVKDLLARRGKLPWDQAVPILQDAARGLAELHDRLGVMHRDVKPSNILLDAAGRAKIADLGLVQTRADLSRRSEFGSQGPPHPGTPGYRSPEHENPNRLSPTADVYGLGCVAFEMLTGKPWCDVRHKADRVRNLAPETPPWLDDLVARMLCEEAGLRAADASNPAKRFVDLKPVIAALEEGVQAEAQRARLAAQQQQRQAAAEREREIAAAARRRALPWMLGSVALLAVLLAVWRPWAGGAGPAPTPAPAALLAAQQTALALTDTPRPASTITSVPRATPSPSITVSDTLTMTPSPGSTATAKSLTAAEYEALKQTAIAAGARTATPTLGVGSTWTSPVDGMVQVYVPAGEFLMGSADSDGDASSDEKPQHKVTLDAFWIDRTEVTKDQYQKCVAAGKCQAPSCVGTGEGNHPVVCVSWQNAADYCAWAGRRLPTEAEWEKAARGTDGRIYPWGNQAPTCDRLNYWGKENGCVGATSAAGLYPSGASPYGALDMAGNVWEWAADWYDAAYYASSPVANPQGPETGQSRVLRGGSWFSEQWSVRAAVRRRLSPENRSDNLGFRCARS